MLNLKIILNNKFIKELETLDVLSIIYMCVCVCVCVCVYIYIYIYFKYLLNTVWLLFACIEL